MKVFAIATRKPTLTPDKLQQYFKIIVLSTMLVGEILGSGASLLWSMLAATGFSWTPAIDQTLS